MTIARISSVVGCVVFAVWLAKEPGWEPLSAFLLSAIGYIGAELAQRSKEAKHRHNFDVVAKKLDESVQREGALHEECRKRQAVIDEFQKDRDEQMKKSLNDVIAKMGKIARGES